MPKINEYPQAATINNNDLFVIDQESGGDHATKSASVSQIAEKVTDGLTANDIPLTSSDPTSTATAIGDLSTAIGDLSTLTTSDTSSLVGAVNSFLPRVVYSKKDWANSHEFATPNDTAFMLYTDSDTSVAKVRIYNNNQVTFNNISGSSITGATYTNGTLTVAVNNRGLVAVRII